MANHCRKVHHNLANISLAGLTLNLYLKLSFAKRQRRQLSLGDNNCLDFRY